MAPPKAMQKISTTTTTTQKPSLARKPISTRSKNIINNDQNVDIIAKKGISTQTINKRKADASPIKNDRVKRSALGNLTNAYTVSNNNMDTDALKPNVNGLNVVGAIVKHKNKPILTKCKRGGEENEQVALVKKTTGGIINNGNIIANASSGFIKIPSFGAEFQIPKSISLGQMPTARPTKVMTRASLRAITTSMAIDEQPLLKKTTTTSTQHDMTAVKKKNSNDVAAKPMTRRISNNFEKTDDSLYVSALEEMSSSDSLRLSLNSRRSSVISCASDCNISEIIEKSPPANVVDFDKENWDDPFQVAHYAMDIFEYLKEREKDFVIDDYMDRQIHLTKWMRMLLVDWMVEVQETFELNHETLYLAVKIVDIYLGKVIVIRDKLQLLGAAALFLACKFDERTPPLIDDFLYICDKAYTQKELTAMERNVFKTIGFDLGIPLSYRFLRRYARCAKVAMPILTLARYVLEMALMEYATITLSDSKIACAALYIALRMNNLPGWTETLEYYTGYEYKDFACILTVLNRCLHAKPLEQIKTVRNKYSHEIFFAVAKIKLLNFSELFESSDSSPLNKSSSSSTTTTTDGGGKSGDCSKKH